MSYELVCERIHSPRGSICKIKRITSLTKNEQNKEIYHHIGIKTAIPPIQYRQCQVRTVVSFLSNEIKEKRKNVKV